MTHPFGGAKKNMLKSAFWTAILKVRPLLILASFYQTVDGTSFIVVLLGSHGGKLFMII
jgi:hypothetical protein